MFLSFLNLPYTKINDKTQSISDKINLFKNYFQFPDQKIEIVFKRDTKLIITSNLLVDSILESIEDPENCEKKTKLKNKLQDLKKLLKKEPFSIELYSTLLVTDLCRKIINKAELYLKLCEYDEYDTDFMIDEYDKLYNLKKYVFNNKFINLICDIKLKNLDVRFWICDKYVEHLLYNMKNDEVFVHTDNNYDNYYAFTRFICLNFENLSPIKFKKLLDVDKSLSVENIFSQKEYELSDYMLSYFFFYCYLRVGIFYLDNDEENAFIYRSFIELSKK